MRADKCGMTAVERILAAHPLRMKPYNSIRFARIGPHARPLYKVSKDPRELGAREALKLAFELHGGHCFHCGRWYPPQPLSDFCSRDHVRPTSKGGGHHLHNLVITCAPCNKRKGARDLVEFHVERGSNYLKALDEHIVRCLAQMAAGASPSSRPPRAPGAAAGP
jgi:5-methylcytosine-specific restriction endonuclease McrA